METMQFNPEELPLRPGPKGELGVIAAMIEAMRLVEPVGKNKYNEQQRFRYRGIDDFLNLMSPILKKVGVLVVPQELETLREERQTAKGGVLFVEHKKVRYTFFHTDGSSVSAVLQGTGMDSADKAGNKALSAAYKYAVTQVFCVPVDDVHVDSEQDDYEVKPRGDLRGHPGGARPAQPRPQPRPQTAQPEPDPDSKASAEHVAALNKYAHLLPQASREALASAVELGTLTYAMAKAFSAQIRAGREKAATEPAKPDGREQAALLYGGGQAAAADTRASADMAAKVGA